MIILTRHTEITSLLTTLNAQAHLCSCFVVTDAMVGFDWRLFVAVACSRELESEC